MAGDGIDRQGNDEAARAGLTKREDGNLSTEHQRDGDARLLSDTLGQNVNSLDYQDGGSRGPPAIAPNGEVKGGGSGAGGGNPGEDFDDDHTAGSNTGR